MAIAPGIRRRLAWSEVTVSRTRRETASARTLELTIPGWSDHRAGQHLDIRLTADDGYQAVRSYSLSSAPGEPPAITVERVDDGEVSSFLVDVVEDGDAFEARGPIGGYFVLEPGPTPALLIGGGSGVAPLRAMWRAQQRVGPLRLRYSAQTADRVIFTDELGVATFDARVTLTRDRRDRYDQGRLGIDALREAIDDQTPAVTFVCGPTAFVESITQHLIELGLDPSTVRTERFG